MAFRSVAVTTVDGNVTVNAPAGLTVGDVLLLACSNDTGTGFGTTPTGLTLLSGPTTFGIDGQTIALYGCIWDGTQSLSFSPGTSADNIYVATAWSGRVTSSLASSVAVTTTTPASTSTSIALTGATSAAGDDIAAFSMPDPASHTGLTQTPPAGYTEPSGADVNVGFSAVDFAYKENVSSGSTGTLTFTASASVEYSGWVVRLAIGTGPNITSQPSSTQVAVGSTATYSVTASASGGGTLSYQWQLNGTNVSTGSGGTTSSYTTGALGLSDSGGSYTCIVTETGGSNAGSATTTAAIGYVGIVRVAVSTTVYTATGTPTTIAPGWPTTAGISSSVGKVLLIIGMKPATSGAGTVTTPSSPWSLLGNIQGAGGYTAGGASAADTGNCDLYVYSADDPGTTSGSLSVTVNVGATNGVAWATMLRYSAPSGSTFSLAMATGSDTSAGNVSITFGSDPGVTANDYVVGAMCIPTDVTTPSQFSAEAFSQTGVTFGTVFEIGEPDSSNNNDIGGFIVDVPISSGTSSAAPTMTATAGGTTTNVRGPGVFVRLRATTGGSTFTPTISGDTAAVTDSETTSLEYLRTPTGDTASVTDGASVEVTKGANDTAAVSDATSTALEYGRLPSDTAAVSDGAALALEYLRVLSDTAAVTDALAEEAQYLRSASDTASLTDSITAGLSRETDVSVSDSASVTDSLAEETQYLRSGSDTLAASDTSTTSTEFGRAASDTVAASDAVAVGFELGRSVSDSSTLTDAAATASAYERLPSDSVVVAETLATETSYVRPVSDTVASTDAVDAQLVTPSTLNVSVSDSLAVTDSETSETAYDRSASDAASVTDQTAVSSEASRVSSDSVAVGDAISRETSVTRSSSDAATASDVLLTWADYARLAGDVADVVDAVEAFIVAPFINVNVTDVVATTDATRVMQAVPDFATDPRRTAVTSFESRTATTNYENRTF